MTYYINNDWEKSEKILNSLQHNGEKRLGVFLLLGNMAAYSGQKDSWMFNKVLLENPFGTIDFLDFSGVIVLPQIEKQNSCRWAINLFGIIEAFIAYVQERSDYSYLQASKTIIITYRIPQKKLDFPILIDGESLASQLGFSLNKDKRIVLNENAFSILKKHLMKISN